MSTILTIIQTFFWAVPVIILGFSSIMLVKDKEAMTRLVRINFVCIGLTVFNILFHISEVLTMINIFTPIHMFFGAVSIIMVFNSVMLVKVKDKEDVTRFTRINLVCIGMIVYAISFYCTAK